MAPGPNATGPGCAACPGSPSSWRIASERRLSRSFPRLRALRPLTGNPFLAPMTSGLSLSGRMDIPPAPTPTRSDVAGGDGPVPSHTTGRPRTLRPPTTRNSCRRQSRRSSTPDDRVRPCHLPASPSRHPRRASAPAPGTRPSRRDAILRRPLASPSRATCPARRSGGVFAMTPFRVATAPVVPPAAG